MEKFNFVFKMMNKDSKQCVVPLELYKNYSGLILRTQN